MTAIIPIVAQLIGLVLGVISLRRIRRAYRHGVTVPGTGWAVTGLVSSGLTLLGWLGFFVVIAFFAATLSKSTDSINAIFPTVANH